MAKSDTEAPVKRPRGRPRKTPVPEEPPVKRPRGRPRKYETEEERIAAKKIQQKAAIKRYQQKCREEEISATPVFRIKRLKKPVRITIDIDYEDDE